MSDLARLQTVVPRVAAVAERFAGKGISEQDTKNALIEPVLEALGWPKTDLERVRAEYRHTSQDNPVDYALFAAGRPVLFVEAKALDKSLDEHRFVVQILTYANGAGLDWAIVTNGRRWDLYAVFARGRDAARKRCFSVQVGDEDCVEWLSWLAPERLDGDQLERLWRLLVAEQAVGAAISRLFGERDAGLVSLLAEESRIDPGHVALALQALRPSFADPDLTRRMKLLGQAAGKIDVAARHRRAGRGPDDPGAVPQRRSDGTPREDRGEPTRPTRFDALAAPPPGYKPVRLGIADNEWEVRSWRDLVVGTLEFVRANRPERYTAAMTASEFQGRKRRALGASPDGMHSAQEVPGGWLEVNVSAAGLVRVARLLVEFAGFAPEQAWYEAVKR